MRHIIILSLLFISSMTSAQLVRIDSTTTAKRIYYYNQAGFYIGSDSVSEKIVRATLDGGDTFKIPTYTLVERDPQKFYTIDSLAPYLKITDLDEKVEDKIGAKLAAGTDVDITYNDGTGVTTISYTGSGGGGGGLTDEQVRDTTIAMFTPGPSIILNETDAEDSVFLDVNINPVESAVQSRIIGKSFGCAIAGTSSITTIGMTFNTTGTANGTTLNSSTAYRARAHKYEYVVTTASTTAVAGYRGGSDEFRGTEGFVYSVTWGPAIGCANTSKRAFAGIRNSPGAPTDVSPSTLTECIGMGYDDASDSNIQIYYNDGSGTASNIDLGSNFAIPTADRTNFYTLILYVPAGGSAYYYKVINESTGNVTTGNVTTNLPPASSFTRPFIYTSVGGVSNQTGIGIFSIYRMSL